MLSKYKRMYVQMYSEYFYKKISIVSIMNITSVEGCAFKTISDDVRVISNYVTFDPDMNYLL